MSPATLRAPLRSIAGRHAADRVRARIDHRAAEQLAALLALAEHLRGLSLTVHAHFSEVAVCERSLWVKCQADGQRGDHRAIYLALDVLGWKPDRARLSRFRAELDVLRIRHTASDAILLLLVRLPAGTPFEPAAA